MSKHTPGPWFIPDDAEDGCLGATYVIAHPMAKNSMSISQAFKQHNANARLIAAAPDLAEALKTVQPYFCDPDFHDQYLKDHPKKTKCPTCGLFVADWDAVFSALKKAGVEI